MPGCSCNRSKAVASRLICPPRFLAFQNMVHSRFSLFAHFFPKESRAFFAVKSFWTRHWKRRQRRERISIPKHGSAGLRRCLARLSPSWGELIPAGRGRPASVGRCKAKGEQSFGQRDPGRNGFLSCWMLQLRWLRPRRFSLDFWVPGHRYGGR